MKKILIVLCLGLLMACGGGGGGGDDGDNIPDFTGVWDASFTLTSDTCNLWEVPAQEDDVMTIEQSGSSVSFTVTDGSTSVGEENGENSFSATQPMEFVLPDGRQCAGIETTAFHLIDDNTAEVADAASLTCDGGLTCQIDYGTGTATRR
jgi:hypothetical protein